MAPVNSKRKHITLTLKQKLEILEKLERGQTATSLAHEYGCGRQAISDFKNQKLHDYARKHLPVDMKHTKSVLSNDMRTAKYEALD